MGALEAVWSSNLGSFWSARWGTRPPKIGFFLSWAACKRFFGVQLVSGTAFVMYFRSSSVVPTRFLGFFVTLVRLDGVLVLPTRTDRMLCASLSLPNPHLPPSPTVLGPTIRLYIAVGTVDST